MACITRTYAFYQPEPKPKDSRRWVHFMKHTLMMCLFFKPFIQSCFINLNTSKAMSSSSLSPVSVKIMKWSLFLSKISIILFQSRENYIIPVSKECHSKVLSLIPENAKVIILFSFFLSHYQPPMGVNLEAAYSLLDLKHNRKKLKLYDRKLQPKIVLSVLFLHRFLVT